MKSTILFAFAATLALLSPTAAQYPDRPVTLIVPFGAGGITDLVARRVGERMATELGQQVVVENRPGAGGTIAAQAAASADPDGYTLFLGTVGSQIVNPILRSDIAYDPETSFEPIGLVAGSPFILAVRADLGVEDYPGFVSFARAHPGELNFASAGVASSPHLGLELLKVEEGLDIVHVPFNSGSDAVNAVAGSQVDLTMDAAAVVMPLAQAGLLRPLLVSAPERLAAAPDVLAASEVGAGGLEITSWNALYVPARTPAERVERLNAALVAALSSEGFAQSLASQGTILYRGAPDEYRTHFDRERQRWGNIIARAGVTLD